MITHNNGKSGWIALMVGFVALGAGQVDAQSVQSDRRPLAANILIPQSRLRATGQQGQVEVSGVTVDVRVVEQVATTTMTIDVVNRTRQRAEAELVVPVPDGAAVRGFAFQGSAPSASARVLPKDEARETYEQIVARLRDPALLEFVGYNLIRSSVFPVEPAGTQRVRLTIEHVLPADGDRVDLVLPRSESLDYSMPWSVNVEIKSKLPISTIYSPSTAWRR